MEELIIKVCGITTATQAEEVSAAGATWIGLNFWPPSSRYLPPGKMGEVSAAIPGNITRVGVFVDAAPQTILRCIEECDLNLVQLHGSESPEDLVRYAVPAFKAIPVETEADLAAIERYLLSDEHTFLLDAKHPDLPGGTGQKVASHLSLKACRLGNCIVAGGLNPKNVERIVRELRPFGVDVASGVESSPGVKDIEAVRQFVLAARRGHQMTNLRPKAEQEKL